jgi:hypothetical protein
MVLITSVSGSMVAQQARSVLTVSSISPIAAVCRSVTPSPEAASATISRRSREARSSHTNRLFHRPSAEAFPEFWDRLAVSGGSIGEADAKISSDGTTVPSMATPRNSAVSERVWSQLPEGCRQVLEAELPPTDLQSLLLSLAQTRARRIRPAEVLRRWKSDRFVRPATIDPGRLAEVENRLWRRLRDIRSRDWRYLRSLLWAPARQWVPWTRTGLSALCARVRWSAIPATC